MYKEWCLPIGLGLFFIIQIFSFFKKLKEEKSDWAQNARFAETHKKLDNAENESIPVEFKQID